MAKALMILALIGAVAVMASAIDSEVDVDQVMESEDTLFEAVASQSEARAAALQAEAAFMRVAELANHVARLDADQRRITDLVINKYNGDIGRLKVGELSRKDQAELIPMGMSYNRDMNVKLAAMAHAASGESDEAFTSFLEADTEAEVEAEAEVSAGMMSEQSLDALLNTMSETTLEHFIAIKQTVLESAIQSALNGEEFEMSAQWPDFVDKAASWVGEKATQAKDAVVDTATNAYNTVKNADIHDISGKVADFAGKVKDISGKVAEYSGPIAALTAPIPYVGAAAKAVDTAANVINKGAGIVQTGAELINKNTKEGETVGEALGRAKDAVVDAGKKAMDYAKNPGKLVDDVKKAASDCIANPSACVDKAAEVAKTGAKLLGQEDIADKIEQGQDMAHKALDALGIKDKNDTEGKEDKPAGGDKKDGKGAGDRGARGDRGDRRGGDRRGDRGGRRGDRRGGDRRGDRRGGR